jgi:small subunit ribosomal protein S5
MNDIKDTTENSPNPANVLDANTGAVAPTQDVSGAPALKGKKTFSFVGVETRKERVKSGGGRGGGRGGPGGRGDRQKSDMAQTMVSIRRVARVMAGGRRFSFSVTMVVGDRNGKVGVGQAKGMDTQLAIDKAVRRAKRAMITVPLTKSKSIARETEAKYASSRIFLKPSSGKGLSAGGSVRTVLDHAGITDIVGKVLSRSKSSFNNAKATIQALIKIR